MFLHTFFQFIAQHQSALIRNLLIHIALSFSATLLATLIGLPLGIWAYQKQSIKRIVISSTSIFQTIPSLALLAFLVPLLGIGFKPTIVTLMLYALLPITRNTFTGLSQLPNETIEAANGLGFTRWQRLWRIELPLATPVIMAGIRTATAMTIGITTIAAFIGAGGLGVFITQGLALNDAHLILLGAIPTALLALIVDYTLSQSEIIFSKQARLHWRFRRTKIVIFLLLLIWLFYGLALHLKINVFSSSKNTIVVASKNFTESYILGYMMSDLLKAHTRLNVVEKFDLGATTLVQQALKRGDIDLYPAYTGTAYAVILKQTKKHSASDIYQIVKKEYKKRFNLIWLPPFGFNSGQTLAVRNSYATLHHLSTLSELAPLSPKLSIAAPAEFIKRPDALPALSDAYGFRFKRIISVEPDLMYRAIAEGTVDVVVVFMTDARIQAFHLTPLNDNKQIYPPYEAAPVIRADILSAHPEIRRALAPLKGLINQKTMRHLNAEVLLYHKTPKSVADHFLIKRGLLSSNPP